MSHEFSSHCLVVDVDSGSPWPPCFGVQSLEDGKMEPPYPQGRSPPKRTTRNARSGRPAVQKLLAKIDPCFSVELRPDS